MFSLEQLDADLKDALKSKNQLAADTLRGLKVRLQNEKISKMKDLSEDEMTALVKSEIKRRKEAAVSFQGGGRQEMADKELQESVILKKYLPAQMSEEELNKVIDAAIAEHAFAAPDFGKAMAAVKAVVGQSADGALVAKLLKEKLTNNN